MSDETLTYLQGDSHGRKRDLITRCYYEVAQGDPKSGPVVFAVLLDAAAEQFAKTPQELLGVVTEFRKLLAEGREMEARIRERVELSNFGVVAEFKDEAVRTKEALRDAVIQADRIKYLAEQMAKEMKPAIATAKEIGRDLIQLRDDLRKFDSSFQRMEKMTADTQSSHISNSALFKHLTKEIRANWATTGLGFGMVLEYALVESQAPPWSGFVFFVLIVGLVQWLLRWDWRHVRTLAEKILPTTITKPEG
jgi:hypothetical protein